VLPNSASRAGSLWQVTQRSRGTAPSVPAGRAWHQEHSMPKRFTSPWSKESVPSVTTFSGIWWQSVQRAVPVPAGCPLKWHRMQVEVVTAMWLPWTICEWHEVQRSVLPRRMPERWAA
jgi:hypothetical protein